MLDPRNIILMPTRVANMVHYLSHGKTIPNIIPDKEFFEKTMARLQAEAHKAERSKVK